MSQSELVCPNENDTRASYRQFYNIIFHMIKYVQTLKNIIYISPAVDFVEYFESNPTEDLAEKHTTGLKERVFEFTKDAVAAFSF